MMREIAPDAGIDVRCAALGTQPRDNRYAFTPVTAPEGEI